MDDPISPLWPAAQLPASDPALAASARLAWQRLARRARAASSGYERERLADVMVTLEALLVEQSLPCSAPDTSARALTAALTGWRSSRDILVAQAQAASVLGEPVPLSPGEPRAEPALLARCLPQLAAGLPALLEHIGKLAERIDDEYLRPASQAAAKVAQVAGQVWSEDFQGDRDAAQAGLAWLLDPVSSAHVCVLMAGAAAPSLRAGDQRAATVTRRWAYARVRTETIEGLSERHIGKTRSLIAVLPR